MAVATVLLTLIIVFVPAAIQGHLNPAFDEGGLIEWPCPIGYFVAIALIFALGGSAYALSRGLSSVIVILTLMLRELDFHSRFTSMNATKLKFYLSPDISMGEKLPAIAIGTFIAIMAASLIIRHGRSFVASLLHGRPASIALAVTIALIGCSQILDGIDHKAKKLGIVLTSASVSGFEKIEETLELGIPIFLIIAIISHFRFDHSPPRSIQGGGAPS